MRQRIPRERLAGLERLRELNARKDHPLTTFFMGPNARRVFASPARYILVEGPNGTGKTHVAAVDLSWTAIGKHPFRPKVTGEKLVLFVPSRDQAYDVWRPRLLGKGASPTQEGEGGLLPAWEIARRKTGRLDIAWTNADGKRAPVSIVMKNGNEIRIRWHGSANIEKRFAGDQYYAGWVDEPGGDMETVLDELVPRFRKALTDYPDHGGRIVWPATDIDGSQMMEEWRERAADPTQHGRYEVIHLTHADNPSISLAAHLEIAEGLSEHGRAIRVDGTEHGGSRRRVYPHFSTDQHVRATTYVPGEYDNVIVSYDPGITIDDTGLLFSFLGPDNPYCLNVWHFHAERGMTIEQEVAVIRRVLAGRRMRAFLFDPHMTTRKEKGAGKSILAQLLDAGLKDKELWVNGRPNPVKPKMKGRSIAPSIKRVQSYLAPPKDMSEVPLVQIDPPTPENGLKGFIRGIRTTMFKKGAKAITAAAIEQAKQEANDCLRMQCAAGFQFLNMGPNMSLAQKRSVIETDVEAQRAEARARARRQTREMVQERRAFARSLQKRERALHRDVARR